MTRAERRALEAQEWLHLQEQKRKFGARVRYYRLEKGLTQQQLAEKAGSSIATIQRIESGEWALAMSLKNFFRLAKALDVEPHTLLRGIRL